MSANQAKEKYMKIAGSLIIFFVVLGTWFCWPLLVAVALRMFPSITTECTLPTVLGQIGDTYGSLNSLLTLILGIAALFTLRMQYRQIREINLQNITTNALTLLPIYFALDPDDNIDQRVHLLCSFILQTEQLPKKIRTELVNSVHPTLKEMEKLKLSNFCNHQIIPPSWGQQ